MIKLLHSADWHLDAPLRSFAPEQAAWLRRLQLQLPRRIVEVCQREGCDLMLLSGDLFDGPWTTEGVDAVRSALADAGVPVFIAPGNHDYNWEKSPWNRVQWPENVYIFRDDHLQAQVLEQLSCRIYGAGYTGPECHGLLQDFQAEGRERYAVAVFHGDPSGGDSPYSPVTALQVRESGLDYVALGHIHSADSFAAGSTLVAWPGCPMGRGYDETGTKGVLIVTIGEGAEAKFHPISGPRFFDWEIPAGPDPLASLLNKLPVQGSRDFYRIALTGEAEPPDLQRLRRELSQFPNLTLVDCTRPAVDLWANADEDSLEGAFFRVLRDACQGQEEETVAALELAAKLSRRILLGQEVELP